MNRVERRASQRTHTHMPKTTTVPVRQVRKSHNGLYVGLSVLCCVLSILWAYTSPSGIPYIFAGLTFIYALTFGRCLYLERKGDTHATK